MSFKRELSNIKKRTSVEDVIQSINNKGCKFLSFVGKYENYKTKINLICLCGHRDIRAIQVINRPSFKGLCITCSKKKGYLSQTKTIEDIVSFVESYGFNSVSFLNGYKNGSSLVSYNCQYKHQTTKTITSFKNNPNCGKCKRIEMSKRFSGENGINWKGGTTQIKKFLQKKISAWKKESAKQCSFRCVITGDSFDEIHHLYSFSNIIRDCFEELDLVIYNDISKYSNEELNLIIEKINEIHNRHPLGVCLRKDIHILFHSLYGMDGETTENDFCDFVDKINNGEIIIEN